MFKKMPNASNLLYTMLVAVLFVGCGYRKTKEIRVNSATYKTEYVIWVYDDLMMVEKFSLPIKKANKKSVDSLNVVVDKYVNHLSELDSY